MKSNALRRSGILIFMLSAGIAASADSSPIIAPRPTAFLITDYLPPANYEGDSLSACFRIENASAREAAFEVSAKAVDAEGKEVRSFTEKAKASAGAFAAVKFEFETRKTARIHIELKRAGEAEALAETNVTLLREDDPWPATKIANGRLTIAEDGSVLIPLVKKKRVIEDRTFAPMKWLFGDSSDSSGAIGGTALIFAPGAWHLNVDSGVQTLGPWTPDGSAPILKTMDRVLSQIGAQKIQRVVILLPPEDLDLATDPRVYRVALDALMARLTKNGVTRTTLICPFRFGCNAAHQQALWHEVHESAAVNLAKVIDPIDWIGESAWRVDPSTPKVCGPSPNAAGRKMIEQALSALIR